MAVTETRSAAAPEAARQTLAMRIAERNRLRELRAERLARLRPPEGAPAPAPERGAATAPAAEPEASAPAAGAAAEPAAPVRIPASDAAQDALEHFLRQLTGGLAGLPPAPSAPAAVLPFQRPEPAPTSDLDRLPGAGPGLVWALERAGLGRLADIAPLMPGELAARLGPIGRLVPAEAWIAVARAAAP